MSIIQKPAPKVKPAIDPKLAARLRGVLAARKYGSINQGAILAWVESRGKVAGCPVVKAADVAFLDKLIRDFNAPANDWPVSEAVDG